MGEKKRSAEEQRQYERWRETMERKHGCDISEYMRRIAAKGGRNGHTGGFAGRPDLASAAGKKGGKNSWKNRKRTADND